MDEPEHSEDVKYTSSEFTQPRGNSEGLLQKELTKTEQEVLHLLVEEFLTPAEIARRRKVRPSAVSNIIFRLRKKGFVSRVNTTPVNYTCTGQGVLHNLHQVRLHAQEFKVGIIRSSERYELIRRRADSVLLEGNRIVLYRDGLIVFSYQSFYGASREDCDRLASAYWLRFFQRLENEYGLLLLKERAQNIREVKAHVAELGNELAQDLRRRKQRCRVFGTKDGKEWLISDFSLSEDELEFTHSATLKEPKSQRDDLDNIRAVFNDYRDHSDLWKPSEMQRALQNVALMLDDSAAGLNAIVRLSKPAEESLAPVRTKEEKRGRPFYVG